MKAYLNSLVLISASNYLSKKEVLYFSKTQNATLTTVVSAMTVLFWAVPFYLKSAPSKSKTPTSSSTELSKKEVALASSTAKQLFIDAIFKKILLL